MAPYLDRLRRAVSRLRARPSRKALEMRLAAASRMALTDELTGARWTLRESPGQLLARADRALYRAKHTGRDPVAVSTGPAHEQMEAR